MERNMQTPLTFDLFDSKARFVMPTAEQIATLDPETQKRFRAVEAAATELEAFKASRKTPQAVNDALAERDSAQKDLERLPKVDADANQKREITFQHAELS
jgi:hypothetical protein